MERPNEVVGAAAETAAGPGVFVVVTRSSLSGQETPGGRRPQMAREESWKCYQFAGGSLAGNDCAPHSSTMSQAKDSAFVCASGNDGVLTRGHGLDSASRTSGRSRPNALPDAKQTGGGGDTGSST
jgi:hypothetical protein